MSVPSQPSAPSAAPFARGEYATRPRAEPGSSLADHLRGHGWWRLRNEPKGATRRLSARLASTRVEGEFAPSRSRTRTRNVRSSATLLRKRPGQARQPCPRCRSRYYGLLSRAPTRLSPDLPRGGEGGRPPEALDPRPPYRRP